MRGFTTAGFHVYPERALAKQEHDPGGGGGGTPLQEANRNVPLDAGSHFHDWIRYNGVAFSIDLLEWGRKFFGFLG